MRHLLTITILLALSFSLHAADLKEKANYWTFQKPARPTIPTTKHQNPIDAFLEQKRQREALKSSPPADRRTLARRIYFDLTGLPPSPEELLRFLNDKSANAWPNLVDHLLASPRYGERWARYWLDIVHFGETHGYDKDKTRPNAWPYRDYVIASANEDMRYPRFVQEQLAGDVLFPDEPRAIKATGFIAAGPWDFVGHVELPETKTDGLIARYNDRDDMVMTTMTTFLSLTVHCARCHDHKFDPISQEDYYRLQAVFAGVDRADRPLEVDAATAKKRVSLATEKEELERLFARIEKMKSESAPEPVRNERTATLGYHSAIEKTADVTKWVQLNFPEPVEIEAIGLVPAYEKYGGHPGPGFGFPARYRIDVSDEADFKKFQTIRDETKADFPQPGGTPIITRTKAKAKHVRITATKLWKRTDDFIFSLGEAWVISGGKNIAPNATVSALDSIEAAPSWAKNNLNDAIAVAAKPELWEKWLERESTIKNFESTLATDLRDELARGKIRYAQVEKEIKALPPVEYVYAAANDFKPSGSFKPPGKGRTVHLLKRGDVKQPVREVSAGALGCLPELPADLEVDPEKEGTRRAALAKWLTRPENLLLRRSIVNRVWQFHFGRGLVDSPNDFGHMGSMPTHPELLDWLAYWFIDNGESLKALHKLIVTSEAYQQSSTENPEFAKIDSDNRYLWRMNRARLDAEELRDAMLMISGQLDLKMGGPSDQQFFFKDDHSPIYDYTRFDVDSPNARRRSIYRFIVRSAPDPFMEALDCPDPSLLTGKRNTTLTALQALATLNNPFVLKQSENLAARISSEKTTDAQIVKAFDLALNRAPTETERTRLADFVRTHGLASACRVIFNMNEFAFVD